MNERQTCDRNTVADADTRETSRNVAKHKQKSARFNGPVYIHVHHCRYRLASPDGLCSKPAIDGFVTAEILAASSPGKVVKLSHTQEKIPKTEVERTIFTIEEV